ncbi:hypothetical protein BDZ90DRAFT_278501 [Jaminaea rosea]|uniref:RING-type E3 ubiquitin transferase n=1 Tax=Jaminaea rosea TaxID=1569628 RepID=A0A316UXU0_9BASI|nr:hypothetical protein BDZ90DRAFT_278501 [Jaminaea rosea]PWN29111.1 hypothetical protein BDZ90DRAFT_278501 [Jaminaea rosea]
MDIWNGTWSPHSEHHESSGSYGDGKEEESQPEAGPSNYHERTSSLSSADHTTPPLDDAEGPKPVSRRQSHENSLQRIRPPTSRGLGSFSNNNIDRHGKLKATEPPIDTREGKRPEEQQLKEAETEEEEEKVCRICRCGPEEDQPLFHPCKCTGSIRYTHQDCLKDWLSHSRKDKCELCDHPFTFHKIYSEDMPYHVPRRIQAAFMTKKAGQVALLVARCFVVVAIWLAFVPWAHINFFRAAFWTTDLLITAAGGGSSTWTNVTSAVMSASNPLSFSAPAAPSPTALPPPPSLGAPGLALTVSGQALIGGVISFGLYATPWAGLGGGISLLLDWALRAETASLIHDIFLGQVLTCIIIVLVLSAWFTREWIVMQMPAQIPEPEPEQERPAQAPAANHERLQRLRDELQRARANLEEVQRMRTELDEVGNAENPNLAILRMGEREAERGWDANPLGEEPDVVRLRQARLAAFLGPDGRANRERQPVREADGIDTETGQHAEPVIPPPPPTDIPWDDLLAQATADDAYRNQRMDVMNQAMDFDAEDHWDDPPPPPPVNEHELLLAGPNPADVHQALAAVQGQAQAAAPAAPPNGNAAAGPAPDAAAAAAAEAEAIAAAADAADLEGEMEGMLEAIGFRGDPVHLLANVSIVMALCTFCIVVGVAMPYFLGRVFGLGKGFIDVVTAPVRLIRFVTDPVFDAAINVVIGKGVTRAGTRQSAAVTSALQAWEGFLALVRTSPASTTAPHATPTPFSSATSAFVDRIRALPVEVIQPIEERLVSTDGSVGHRSLCVGLGHFWWIALLALRLIGEDVMRRHQPSSQRPSWWLRDGVTQVLIVIKVLIFLAIEIVVFPIGCALVLDLCTLPLRGVTLHSALLAPLNHPFSFTFIRWAIGTLWMFRFGLYMSHVRSFVRPGVLSWIRDPEDPEFQPIKEILERKGWQQLRKIGTSGIMYGCLILALVGWNVQLAWWAWGERVLPLRFPHHSWAPYDLMCILLLVPAGNPENLEDAAAWASRKWWRAAGDALRLSGYLFGDEDDGAGAAAAGDTFLARIPASDNSVPGSPLLIRIDEATGEPISERGKEALREQEARIESMPEPKAKYVTMRLPTHFGRRVYGLLFLNWLTFSIVVHALLGALVLGRRIINEGQHDGYALAVGCTFLCLPFVGARWAYKGIAAVRRRGQTHVARLRIARRFLRRSFAAVWLTLALGVFTPSLLGIVLDQVIVSPLRPQSTLDKNQTCLPFAWAMGLLAQELFVYGVADYLPANRQAQAVQELRRRGWKRIRAWPATRDLVLPIVVASLAAIVLPLLIVANITGKGASREREIEALQLGRLVVLAAVLAWLVMRLMAMHLDRFDRELRDEVYLKASELRNFEDAADQQSANGADRAQQDEEAEQQDETLELDGSSDDGQVAVEGRVEEVAF